jgi:predicted nucleic-acid-binding protein
VIALDTNVLVRYLVQDDPVQSPKAEQILEGLSESSRAFVSCVVLCEVFWVLKTSYRLSKESLIHVLDMIVSVTILDIEHHGSCLRALQAYQSGRADFSDYLIQAIASHYGHDRLLTFDKTAGLDEGFVLL